MGADRLRRAVARLSRGDLLLLVALLAVFGVVDAVYLTYQWYQAASASWCDLNPLWSCTAVRESPYASFGGVAPTSLVGVAGFVVLLALAVLALRGVEKVGPWSVDRWLLVFAILGSLVGLGLSIIEVFVIHAICILCVLGFVLDLIILGAAVLLVRGGATVDAGG